MKILIITVCYNCGKTIRDIDNTLEIINQYPHISILVREKDTVLYAGINVQINDNVHITTSKKVVIGNNVLMVSKIYISDTIHGSYLEDDNDSSPNIPPNKRTLSYKEVIIHDNVWIGESVTILPGVIIKKGAIIGANSVITKNVEANTIVAGIPAKPIKKYNFELKKWEKII